MATKLQTDSVKALVETGGIVSTAMIKGGYSKKTAKTPQKLTNSKGFKELCEKYLPDELLIKVHKEGLKAVKKEQKIIGRDDDGKPEYEMIDVEDYAVRHKYLETAYKIKGKIGYEEPPGLQVNINLDFRDSEIIDYERWRKQRILEGIIEESTNEESVDLGGGQQDVGRNGETARV